MKNIKLYAAPLEGVTGYVWRKAHKAVFEGVDKYFTPFVVANQTHKLKTKELRDLTGGKDIGKSQGKLSGLSPSEENLVPQVLTDKGEHFLWAACELADMGFGEVNLNLGCPSATAFTRGKGAGVLTDPENLDRMLWEIFDKAPAGLDISVKTRIGVEDKAEWPALMEIFGKYPISELIIHPRLRAQHYNGVADRELFKDCLQVCGYGFGEEDEPGEPLKTLIAYNGDVRRADDEAFDYGCNVMAGRGLIADPALMRKARGGAGASRDELRAFHDMLVAGYSQYMQGDSAILHHMKEFWFYHSALYECSEKQLKRISKARSNSEYLAAAGEVIRNCRIRKNL